MDHQSNQSQGLSQALSNLTDRERMLLGAMVVVAVLIGIFIAVTMARQSLADVEAEAESYNDALTAIIAQGPAYMEAQAGGDSDDDHRTRADLFTEEVLEDNDVQLTSYVASHASAVDVSVSSYDVDEQPLGALGDDDEGPMLEERQLRADIRNAEMDRLVELLHRLEESREPVVTTRVDIRSVRDEGEVRALVVVSTFEYLDEEEES